MNRPAFRGIRHIALKVRNLEKTRRFYTEVLGYSVEWEPDPANVYLTSGSDNLALHQDHNVAEAGSLDHLGILVDKPEDVDAWASYLKSRDVQLKQEPRTHRDGARSIYFHDPDGNLIQLIFHPPLSGK